MNYSKLSACSPSAPPRRTSDMRAKSKQAPGNRPLARPASARTSTPAARRASGRRKSKSTRRAWRVG
eukprot:15472772-Alexandrium_andersonii.AAC.1